MVLQQWLRLSYSAAAILHTALDAHGVMQDVVEFHGGGCEGASAKMFTNIVGPCAIVVQGVNMMMVFIQAPPFVTQPLHYPTAEFIVHVLSYLVLQTGP